LRELKGANKVKKWMNAKKKRGQRETDKKAHKTHKRDPQSDREARLTDL